MSWTTSGNWRMNSPMPQSLQTTAKLELKFTNSFLLLHLLTLGINSKIEKLFDWRNLMKKICKCSLSTSTKATSKLALTRLKGFKKSQNFCLLISKQHQGNKKLVMKPVLKPILKPVLSLWERSKSWMLNHS